MTTYTTYHDWKPTHKPMTGQQIELGILTKQLQEDHDTAIEGALQGKVGWAIVTMIGTLTSTIENIKDWNTYLDNCENEALCCNYSDELDYYEYAYQPKIEMEMVF